MVFATMSLRKVFLLLCVGFLGVMIFVGCGSSSSSSAASASPTQLQQATQTQPPDAKAIATASALAKLVMFIGQPTAKMVSGKTFEVTGQIKNVDTKQHDFTVQARLLDASGTTIATATQLVDNVPGGATVSYTIMGTTPQSTWQNVQVAVIKVSENLNGSN